MYLAQFEDLVQGTVKERARNRGLEIERHSFTDADKDEQLL